MKERSLITGSRGFLGEHLLARLAQQGQEVLRGDREGNCPKGVDHIFDLASYGNLFHQKDIEAIYTANFFRLKNLLQNAEDYQAFIVISTSSVKLPHLTFYAAAKLAGESLARAMALAYSQPIVVVRPFSITGVGEQEEHLIPKLIRSCLYGEQMPFVSEPVHDFIDVQDVAEALWILAKNARKHKGEIFEIGRGLQYTNEEVKNIVEEITGKKANVQLVKSIRPYDTSSWMADPTKIKSLGWRPQKSINQTIEEMVENERKNN